VITDHDVHAEGAELLSKLRCSCSPASTPEYHTTETLDALGAYLENGGRFIYLGGNGFLLEGGAACERPLGLRTAARLRAAIRLWATQPGESYHAFDGSYGGLWRRLGRPPQMLAGGRFQHAGRIQGFSPTPFLDGILDPRVAFMREGMEGNAKPGSILGERGA